MFFFTLLLYLLIGAPSSIWIVSCIIIFIIVLMYFLSRLKLLPNFCYFNIRSIFYFFWLAKEIFISSWKIANMSWKKNMKFISEICEIDLKQNTDLGLVIFANSITLTPGTVTIAQNGDKLVVQALDESLIKDLKKGEMSRRINAVINY
ncbi:MAG: Na+/H+ antiporter subunit E [Rickettsia sp.]|nr:Na+/H+ antiporter subunit E [Rickettsia sp.]